mgnify:CR=1 FL=1
MKEELKQQIIESAKAYATEHALSQNDVAKQSGVGSKYISDLWNGKWSTDAGNGKEVVISDKYFLKLAEFCGIKVKKEYWETRVTPQLKRIISTLEVAKESGTTNIIIGETGCGKTYVCDLFRRKHPADMWVITVMQTDTIRDIIERILDALKINTSVKSSSAKLKHIIVYLQDLRKEGKRPMLLFDECEYMKQPALCAMKSLYDNLKDVCSIVMVGTDQLITHLDQLKRRNKDGMPQFCRRIKIGTRHLDPIDRRFNEFLGDIEDRELVKFLREYCENYGELHDVMVLAKREAEITGSPLTVDFMKAVLNLK